MPKFGSGWSREENKPTLLGRILGGRTARDPIFSDRNIDKLLKQGKSGQHIKNVLKNEMKGLTASEQRKIINRIDTRETKSRQGKSDGNKGKK